MTSKIKPAPAANPAASAAPAYWVAPSQVPHQGGAQVLLAGHTYVLAPAPLTPFATFMRSFEQARAAQAADPHNLALTAGMLEAVAVGVHLSLRRNYPQLTLDQVGEELLDQRNWREAIDKVFEVSGAQPAGEPTPGSR